MENSFYLTCPLDRNHRILVGGLQKHLKKCIKSRSMNGLTKCPYNRQHQVDASQILEHCDTCPNGKNILNQKTTNKCKQNSSNNDGFPIRSSINHPKPNITIEEKLPELRNGNRFLSINDALIQENVYKNKDDLSLNNASSMKNAACHSTTTLEENGTTSSKDYFEIAAESQLEKEIFHPKPLRRPAIETLRTSIVKTPMEEPCIQRMEIHKTDKISSEVVGMINSESDHTITSDTNSKDLSSHCANQPKSLATKDIGIAELYEKLKKLKADEVAIKKELQILRQKEKKK
ncbi:uncharacterized protein [Chelonus insularis]|uniref:uncharacterized protein isoform X2 n=1 Tax=Chelonus insularis TaxID=460826 RepID=UPI00158B3387|nr:uncharacterized protein LOC118065068 isoform X2 [Chelonus insularis]